MRALEALYLSHNSILTIHADAFAGLDNLLHLDLSRNFAFKLIYDPIGITRSMLFEHADVFAPLKSLKSLDFSYTRMNQRNVVAFRNLGKSLERLSLCSVGALRFGENFLRGTSLRILDVSGVSNLLSSFNALHGLESTLEVLYASDIALTTFDVFENFSNLKILKLTRNYITTVRRQTATSLINLKILDLSSNRLNSWFQTIFSNMVSLEVLDLLNNNINIISEEMMDDFANVSYVGLSGNSLVCNCRSNDLIKLAAINELRTTNRPIRSLTNKGGRFSYHIGFDYVNQRLAHRRNISYLCERGFCDNADHLNGIVLLSDYSSATYNCIMTRESKSIPMVRVTGCSEERRSRDLSSQLATGWNKLFILLLLPCLLLPLSLGFVFRRNLRYFCVTLKNSALISMVNKNRIIDDDTIFNYDVFVSYCNEDRAWVLDQLLGHLERHCSISLCLHERDFQVGISILENIVSCMDRSKFILLVISKQFLLSHWCQFEMHLAQHRLLETRREDLILILLEEIPRRFRPNTLHYLMLTKTYIVWPKNKSDQHLFWKRLEKSVEAQKNKRKENVSLA
ncbi:unnamed protein product [Diatraea saccharalis]|uniref:TIR domain-containing protein n=1 Tax=Diatraea saccharalis TaxID=40085 RepID=A0A9N9RDK7_9NEOP|nr:unnamed protein product [Diatraea saccharalis]